MTRPTGNFSESNTYGQHYSESARIGENNAVTISESSTPKSFTFTAGDESDISEQADLTISNDTSSSVSETITVELYDGTDTTGTKIDSESKSVSVSATSNTTATFIARRNPLDAGDYHINVTQSGTTLSIDQTDLTTTGGEYTFDEDNIGDLVLLDQDGNERGRFPAIGNGLELSYWLSVAGGFGQLGYANLIGTTGDFDGQIQNHDGTDTSGGTALAKGAAQWDATNAVWISLVDGTTFS